MGLVSLAAGAAMAEAASEASGLDVRCKWPNDLLVGADKVGGILGEAAARSGGIDHVVVGFGVNLEVPDDVPGAGAIGVVDAEMLLGASLRAVPSVDGGRSRRDRPSDGARSRPRWAGESRPPRSPAASLAAPPSTSMRPVPCSSRRRAGMLPSASHSVRSSTSRHLTRELREGGFGLRGRGPSR